MTADPIPTVETIDKSEWPPEDYPLLDRFVNFARMANAVVTEPGPLQGWFSEALWRNYSFAPFNGRVLENYYSLAFFYGYQAPWNIYFNHPGVLERLALTLRYTFNLMADNGAIPEYAAASLDTPMLAPSSFGMEYMAAALDIAGPLLPDDLKYELIDHARKAAVYVLTSEESWSHARAFTNQFLGAMAGGAKLAHLTQDAELKAMVERAGEALLGDFIAPMGFLYENNGPETFAYFFVTLRRLIHLYQAWPGEPLRARLRELLRRHCAWMSRWLLPEPDGATILLSGSHQTRTQQDYRLLLAEQFRGTGYPHLSRRAANYGLGGLLTDGGAEIEEVHEVDERRFLKVFLLSAEDEREARQLWAVEADTAAKAKRRGLRTGYPPVSVLACYKPYAPPAAEIEAARHALPCLQGEIGAETQQDDRGNQYTFIRQPNYYLAFAFAGHQTRASHGPAFLWHPVGGTLILSENGQGICWETQMGEMGDWRSGQSTGLAMVREGRGGYEILLTYKPGFKKTYVVRPEGIDVLLGLGLDRTAGEHIPLLLREDDMLYFDYGRCPAIGLGDRPFGAVSQTLIIERLGVAMLRFDFGAPVPFSLAATYDPDGFIRAHLLFKPASIYFGRTGYRLHIE